MRNSNILMVGVGGQGIVLAGNILSLAALKAGYDVKKSEIHGMSQRGGSVFSHVRYGERVYSPVIGRGEADLLLSLEEMETLRWVSWANAGTRAIVLQNRIKPAMAEQYPAGLEEELKNTFPVLSIIDPDELLKEVGEKKYMNVSLLGFLSVFINIPEEAWKAAVELEVPSGTLDKNWNAFLKGRSMASWLF